MRKNKLLRISLAEEDGTLPSKTNSKEIVHSIQNLISEVTEGKTITEEGKEYLKEGLKAGKEYLKSHTKKNIKIDVETEKIMAEIFDIYVNTEIKKSDLIEKNLEIDKKKFQLAILKELSEYIKNKGIAMVYKENPELIALILKNF